MIKNDIDFVHESLKSSLELRSKLLAHPAEKGRFNENQLGKVLRRFLPKKMDIGTGFIACSDRNASISRQQDIVIYDSWQNVPLFYDEVLNIFSVESVYGTVEVKTTLTAENMEEAFSSNKEIRDMAINHGKFYVVPSFRTAPKKSELAEYDKASSNTPPRFFLFAYDCVFEKLETLKRHFEEQSIKNGSHCHGLCVLTKDWFIARNAYDKNEYGQKQISVSYNVNGFSIFISKLIKSLNTIEMAQVDMSRYEDLKLDLSAGEDTNGEITPLSESLKWYESSSV